METLRRILRIFFIIASILSFQGWVILGSYELGLADGKALVSTSVDKPKPDKKYFIQVLNESNR